MAKAECSKAIFTNNSCQYSSSHVNQNSTNHGNSYHVMPNLTGSEGSSMKHSNNNDSVKLKSILRNTKITNTQQGKKKRVTFNIENTFKTIMEPDIFTPANMVKHSLRMNHHQMLSSTNRIITDEYNKDFEESEDAITGHNIKRMEISNGKEESTAYGLQLSSKSQIYNVWKSIINRKVMRTDSGKYLCSICSERERKYYNKLAHAERHITIRHCLCLEEDKKCKLHLTGVECYEDDNKELDIEEGNALDSVEDNAQDIEEDNAKDIEEGKTLDIVEDNAQDIEEDNVQDIEEDNLKDIEEDNAKDSDSDYEHGQDLEQDNEEKGKSPLHQKGIENGHTRRQIEFNIKDDNHNLRANYDTTAIQEDQFAVKDCTSDLKDMQDVNIVNLDKNMEDDNIDETTEHIDISGKNISISDKNYTEDTSMEIISDDNNESQDEIVEDVDADDADDDESDTENSGDWRIFSFECIKTMMSPSSNDGCGKIRCIICDNGDSEETDLFIDVVDAMVHVIKHHSRCGECGIIFKEYFVYQNHLQSVHAETSLFGEITADYNTKKKNYKALPSPELPELDDCIITPTHPHKPWVCRICSMKTERKGQMMTHVMRFHFQRFQDPFRIKLCQKRKVDQKLDLMERELKIQRIETETEKDSGNEVLIIDYKSSKGSPVVISDDSDDEDKIKQDDTLDDSNKLINTRSEVIEKMNTDIYKKHILTTQTFNVKIKTDNVNQDLKQSNCIQEDEKVITNKISTKQEPVNGDNIPGYNKQNIKMKECAVKKQAGTPLEDSKSKNNADIVQSYQTPCQCVISDQHVTSSTDNITALDEPKEEKVDIIELNNSEDDDTNDDDGMNAWMNSLNLKHVSLGTQIPANTIADIREGKYVDIYYLIYPEKRVKQEKGESPFNLFSSFEEWEDAMKVYAGIYVVCQQWKSKEFCRYIHYIQDLSNKISIKFWNLFDQTFRKIRYEKNLKWDKPMKSEFNIYEFIENIDKDSSHKLFDNLTDAPVTTSARCIDCNKPNQINSIEKVLTHKYTPNRLDPLSMMNAVQLAHSYRHRQSLPMSRQLTNSETFSNRFDPAYPQHFSNSKNVTRPQQKHCQPNCDMYARMSQLHNNCITSSHYHNPPQNYNTAMETPSAINTHYNNNMHGNRGHSPNYPTFQSNVPMQGLLNLTHSNVNFMQPSLFPNQVPPQYASHPAQVQSTGANISRSQFSRLTQHSCVQSVRPQGKPRVKQSCNHRPQDGMQ